MNGWLLAATGLLVAGIGPCVLASLRGAPVERLIALEMATVLGTVEMLLLARGFDRSSYQDVALLLAVLSLGGSLAFARFFGRLL